MSHLSRQHLESELDEYDDVTTPTKEERRSGDNDPSKVLAGRLRQVRRRRRIAVWSIVVWIVVATTLLAGSVHGWWQTPSGVLVGFVVGSGVGLAFGFPKLAHIIRAEQLYELLHRVEKGDDVATPA